MQKKLIKNQIIITERLYHNLFFLFIILSNRFKIIKK